MTRRLGAVGTRGLTASDWAGRLRQTKRRARVLRSTYPVALHHAVVNTGSLDPASEYRIALDPEASRQQAVAMGGVVKHPPKRFWPLPSPPAVATW
jgi:hypothetical protein